MEQKIQEDIIVAITIITIVFLIISGLIYVTYLHNKQSNEQLNQKTPYQRCSDDCMNIKEDNTLKLICKSNCTTLIGKKDYY